MNRQPGSKVRVSYIVSTKDRAEFLDSTLENVRDFITHADELIIIDGASKDDTPAIVGKHADIVTAFQSEPDSSEAHGFNKGLLMSRGRFIKLLTDDDYVFPEAMHHAIEVLESHPEIDALQCGGEHLKPDSETGELRVGFYNWFRPDQPDKRKIRFITASSGLGLIFRRRVLALVGLLSPDVLCVDLDFLSRLLEEDVNLRFLNVRLYRHYVRGHSGVQQIEEREQDLIHVLMRTGRWKELITNPRYPYRAIAGVWGLSDLRWGESLMDLIWAFEKIRRTRAGILVKWLGSAVWAITRAGRRREEEQHSERRLEARLVAPKERPDEPEWDGSLV